LVVLGSQAAVAELLLHALALAQAGVSDEHAEAGFEGGDGRFAVVRWDIIDGNSSLLLLGESVLPCSIRFGLRMNEL
jgi:hypothetical protein